MIRGMIQVHLRTGVMLVPTEVDDEAAIIQVLAELAEDVSRGDSDASPTPDKLFQLRPGLWVRRHEVIGFAFHLEG